MTKYIEEETGKKPSFGSIYPLLDQLKKEGFLSRKIEKNKKFYTLTKTGEEQLESLLKKKDELFKKLEEGMQLFSLITDDKEYEKHIKAIHSIKKSEFPLEPITEIIEIKKILMNLMVNKPNKIKRKQITQVLKNTMKELKNIK